jgi:hypothetical protein
MRSLKAKTYWSYFNMSNVFGGFFIEKGVMYGYLEGEKYKVKQFTRLGNSNVEVIYYIDGVEFSHLNVNKRETRERVWA